MCISFLKMDDSDAYDPTFDSYIRNSISNNRTDEPRQGASDNRSVGLASLDNLTLAGNENGAPNRRGNRKRSRVVHYNDEEHEPRGANGDNENLERTGGSKIKPTDVVSWSYVPLDNFVGADDDLYDTSCDELEEKELEHKNKSRRKFEEPTSDNESENKIILRDNNSVNSDDEEEGEDKLDVLNMPESDIIPTRETKVLNKTGGGECFGCMWSSGKNGENSIPINKLNILNSIMDQHYGTMENAALAKVVHMYFKKKIHKEGGSIPIWRTRMIKEHIEKHTLDPRIYIGESIRKFKRVLNVVDGMLLKEEVNAANESHTVVNEKCLRAILDLHRRITEMYKSVPREMNFYTEDRKISFEYVGRFVNLSKNFTLT